MDNLEKKLKIKKKIISKPTFFRLSKKEDAKNLENLLNKENLNIIDDYKGQIKELFEINNPPLVFSNKFDEEYKKHLEGLNKKEELWSQGVWVYLPWFSTLSHILDENDFYIVRTARNKNLITSDEQKSFYDAHIGIAGLSVGSSIVRAIVLQGGGKNLKIADNDVLALSNTNRVMAGIDKLGIPKTDMTAQQIYEVNPYANIEIFENGLTKENIDSFFNGLDIVIDEIDNLGVKYLIREQAKKRKIPVLMAADNADSGVIDIERYDLDQNTEFFHGRMGDITYDSLNNLDKRGIGEMIVKHIGPKNVEERMMRSLSEIGKSIISWPQLGGTALLNGSAVSYCVRKISNNQKLENDRSIISFDEKLVPNYNFKKRIIKK